MLLCETTRDGAAATEDLALFAGQLAALGLPARIPVGSVPDASRVAVSRSAAVAP